jgi:hypothetical protein
MPSTTAYFIAGGTMVNRGQPGETWRKSSYSSGGACFEVCLRSAEVLVRDSMDPNGAVLHFDRTAFDDFVSAVKRGEFDRR